MIHNNLTKPGTEGRFRFRVIQAPGYCMGNQADIYGYTDAENIAKQHAHRKIVVVQEYIGESGGWNGAESTDWADWAHGTAYAAGLARKVVANG